MFKKICLLRKEERSGELYCTVYTVLKIFHIHKEKICYVFLLRPFECIMYIVITPLSNVCETYIVEAVD